MKSDKAEIIAMGIMLITFVLFLIDDGKTLEKCLNKLIEKGE